MKPRHFQPGASNRGYHELQVALVQEGQKLLQVDVEGPAEFQDFEKQLADYFDRVSEVNRADLARYVCHRKAIIEFLRQQLGRQADGKYRREDRIHNIVFPRGRTSREVWFDEHNLWLLDERLAFHAFLSSDKPLAQAASLDNSSRAEPDLLIFDKAVAFSESDEAPFNSITVVEFKRPQREEYGENENPFTQVADYVRDIRAGKVRMADGRSLPVPEDLPFYCYVVCDLTRGLERWAENFELQKTPDGLGFFGYKRALRAYCEAISYPKLVSDAEKRNRAFFEKLGLPKRLMR